VTRPRARNSVAPWDGEPRPSLIVDETRTVDPEATYELLDLTAVEEDEAVAAQEARETEPAADEAAAPAHEEPKPETAAETDEPATPDEIESAAAPVEEPTPGEKEMAGAATEGDDEGTAGPPSPEEGRKVEAQKRVMMNFLDKGLRQVQASRPRLDNFNKFGVNLFVAGACEALGTEASLSRYSIANILRESVKVLGNRDEVADTFAEKYDAYLVSDPRYLQMFHAGRHAMSTYLKAEDAAAPLLDRALNEWNERHQPLAPAEQITVMFTDIVGSTVLAQTRGDEVAQKVVRTHNRVVRDTLKRANGTEIKHTGDGIMASFASSSSAVEAAVAIQEQVRTHNAVDPDLPLHIRIGINAGQPIIEDNDLFGSTVQLAARICDAAAPDEILVSEIVRQATERADITFLERGAMQFKGFEDPMAVAEVIWDEDRAAAVRALQAAQQTGSDAAGAENVASAPDLRKTAAPNDLAAPLPGNGDDPARTDRLDSPFGLGGSPDDTAPIDHRGNSEAPQVGSQRPLVQAVTVASAGSRDDS
jgi:adenylate cyclase